MARKDIYHLKVVKALHHDGWKITDDPLVLAYGGHNLYADLGAEHPIGAEKQHQRIAVEIKSFVSISPMFDLYVAVGQYNVYRDILAERELPYQLFLAVPQRTHDTIFSDELGELIIRRQNLLLIVFDDQEERIVKWIK